MKMVKRRAVIKTTAAILTAPHILANAADIDPTPRQATGPFYPDQIPLDADADLVQVEGKPRLATGIISHLTGKVLDANGCVIPDVKVEIWQCDAFGAYHHPRDRGGQAEDEFQGYGFTETNSEGDYRFRTIRPEPYPGRTPHIHVHISKPGMQSLTTQLYIEGEPSNRKDFLFNAIKPELRANVTTQFPTSAEQTNTVISEFNIILGHTTACT